ncbi:cryptochrome/photolyase family protein [Actinomarinicola tropica]|uniref:Deoxyribodipyrimidine photo-lyase n=1 Tax=Actinomarinicola tropica TaxID=2789776 RepID=A0A5Q2RFS2_9ACTN|nr:deoxyribodipyrimidine photo-lyase [Actinomarinicola tropica]QGG95668.1 deoxyribodipyrimidine photo-lyase [Actinomarinicola tropica]
MTRPTVMWFRRDLRLADNPALAEAARRGQVLPLFVIDPALWEPAGANRRWFLLGCLDALSADLDGRLVVRVGDPVEVVPSAAREVDASAVVCAADHGPYGRRRDEEVERVLDGDEVPLERIGSAYAVEPGTVVNRTDAPYKVFTPFYRAWRDVGWPDPVQRPRSLEAVTGIASDPLPDRPDVAADLPEPGEAAARRRLDTFLRHRVERYGELRDEPAQDATSRLSPYLKWGCLHPRQILHRLGRTEGEETFRSEVAWREFYADVLLDRPDTTRRAYQEKMRRMRVDAGRRADERFAAWAEGRTGYPLVDAGMRQLLGEGWVHNRVRMVVASFLVKDLHVDWSRGAHHFMQHLVDGDLASNTHGWQWVAGTGTDAAPFFRIFNPVSQSKKFDPDGDYIRRWVPELAHLDRRRIHEPWTAPADLFGDADYPEPIVDHAAEREEALARYDEVR